MQVIMIMGIFGAVYAAIVGLTIAMSLSSMQKNEILKEEVAQAFHDIEYGITNGYLAENADLRAVPLPSANLDLDFIAEYVKWSSDELTNDPWDTAYLVKAYINKETIYVDGGFDASTTTIADNSSVQAPMVAFLIASYGPDRQADVPAAYNAANSYATVTAFDTQDPSITDDIIYTFTTREAMLKHWNEAKLFTDNVGAAAALDYKQQYAMFKNDIAAHYTTYDIDLIDSGGNIDKDAVNSWRVPFGGSPAIPHTTPGFPKMNDSVSDLGLGAEYAKLPASFRTGTIGGTFTVSGSGVNTDEIVDISFKPTNATAAEEWEIEYNIRVDGSSNDF